MGNTKFTIIVPTRERCDTLEATLKTCLNQHYNKFEILVSDNFSQDNTLEVVNSFKDDRIRYINTGQRVNMSENWEFALSHVKDGYVTYLGDDDGMLPGALSDLDKIISETSTEALVWKTAHYNWPNYIEESLKNTLYIYYKSNLQKLSSKEMLNAALESRIEYHILPCIYNAFVSYDAIKRIKDMSGKFFHSLNPDLYSGVALACTMETYYYSYKPYSVSGSSSHSGGRSFLLQDKSKPEASQKFLSENNIPFHHRLVLAPSIPIMVAESVLQAQEHIPAAHSLSVDVKYVLETALQDALRQPPAVYEKVAEAIREIGIRNQLENFVSQLFSKYKYVPINRLYPAFGYNIRGKYLLLQCDEFEVYDIFQACLLCKHILSLKNSKYLTPLGIAKATAISARRLLTRKIYSTAARYLRK